MEDSSLLSTAETDNYLVFESLFAKLVGLLSRKKQGKPSVRLMVQCHGHDGEGGEAEALVDTYSSPGAYTSMRLDKRRNHAYRQAIIATLLDPKLTTWLEIGVGAEILLTKNVIDGVRKSRRSFTPLQYVGIEANETSFLSANQALTRYLETPGEKRTFNLYSGHSIKDYEHAFKPHLPKKFDVVLCEIFGDFLSSEGFPNILHRARADGLIDKATRVLPPYGATLFLPSSILTSAVTSGQLFVGPKLAYIENRPTSLSEHVYQHPGVLEFYNFNTMGIKDLRQTRTSYFKCIKSGYIDSITCFIWVYFDHKVHTGREKFGCSRTGDPFLNSVDLRKAMGVFTPSIGFTSRDNTNFTATNWNTPVVLLPRPLSAVEGETVIIDSVSRADSDLPSYYFKVTVGGTGDRVSAVDVTYNDVRAHYREYEAYTM